MTDSEIAKLAHMLEKCSSGFFLNEKRAALVLKMLRVYELARAWGEAERTERAVAEKWPLLYEREASESEFKEAEAECNLAYIRLENATTALLAALGDDGEEGA